MDLSQIYEPIKTDLKSVEEKIRIVSQGELGWLEPDLAGGLYAASRIREILSHILSATGKRMRPALLLLSSRFSGDTSDSVVTMAAAIELFHIATLIHDDAIDNSILRHGRPTINSLWGDNAAILMGDFLFAKAGEMAITTGNRTVAKKLHQTLMTIVPGELAQTFNAFKLKESQQNYLNRITSKTAALLSLSCECGAILSHAPPKVVKALKGFGFDIGIAFQVVDDILDYIGTTEEMGKPAGSDLMEGTITLPVLFLLERYPTEESIYEVIKNRNRRQNVDRVKELIRNSPIVIQDCYELANKYVTSAITRLTVLPDQPEKVSLTEMARFIAARRK